MIKYDDLPNRMYDYVLEHISNVGYAPTLGEMQKALGVGSLSTVKLALDNLIYCGKLETDHPGSTRALRVPGYKFIKIKP